MATFYLDPRTYFNLNNGVFNRAELELWGYGGDTRATLRITPDIFGSPGVPVTIFADTLITGMDITTFDFRVAFGGRTGGERTSLDLDNILVMAIPEPSTLAIWALGVLALAAYVRRRR